MNKLESELPIILIHKQLEHLQWICSLNAEEELESILINKHTKETQKSLITSEDVPILVKEFEERGWVKGYIPDINILNDGKIIKTIKLT